MDHLGLRLYYYAGSISAIVHAAFVAASLGAAKLSIALYKLVLTKFIEWQSSVPPD